jgi:hypothetical protein
MTHPRGILILEDNKMTVTLTLNEITAEQAEKILDIIHDSEEAPEPAPKAKAKTKAKKGPVEETVDPGEFEDVTPDEPEESATIEEVRAALQKLVKKKGKDAAKAVLVKFGVTKVTDLDEGHYAAVLKEVG